MAYRLAFAALVSLSACAQSGTNGGPAGNQNSAAEDEASLPAPDEDSEEQGWDGYRAGGNEPFWNLELTGGQMVFEHFDAPGATAPLPEPQATPDGQRLETTADGQPFIVAIENAYCADSMSGRPFPDTVIVTVHGESYRGCGGDTASLLTGRPWQVALVGEEPVAGSVGMTVRFAGDGSVSGYGGCNRYSGRYEVGGEGISTAAIEATERACLDPATTQLESDFLAALGRLRSFRIEDDTTLVLIAEDGVEITARR